MTPETYVGSNVDAILQALTPALAASFGAPLECRVGSAEEARVGAPPRCVWVPPKKGTRVYTGTAQMREDLHIKAVHDVAVLFHVHLWGASYGQAEQLEIALEAALYNTFSPNAYELGPEGTQEGDNAPTGAGQTFLFVVPVRLLRIPLPVVTYKTVTVTQATALGSVIDGSGNSSAGPGAGTTYP
jgi:hypothetical protein